MNIIYDLFNNGLPPAFLALAGAALGLYLLAAVWIHLSTGRTLWQNLLGRNQLELPNLSKLVEVRVSGSEAPYKKASILVNSTEEGGGRKGRDPGIIYPVGGRNGIYFAPSRCTSCGLCVYICPTGAVSTTDTEAGYSRNFDLAKCVYCGLCESACPTQAIKLTFCDPAPPNQLAELVVQGQIKTEPCPQCNFKVPRPDLLAGRIYNFTSVIEAEAVILDQGSAFTTDSFPLNLKNPDNHQKAPGQSGEVCPACLKRVLLTEERISN